MGSRLSPGQLAELCDTVLAGDLSRGVAAPEVVTALYRLLAFAERPVTAARLAAATGCTAIEEVLRRLPNIERDEHGTVVGFGGLTRRPTQRQLDIAGRLRTRLVRLGHPVPLCSARHDRRCPVPLPRTGQPISLTVTPAGIVRRDPSAAVLSFVDPDTVDGADLRASFCAALHFLADPAVAERWSAQHHAHLLILDLEDAFALGSRMNPERCGC